jgi:hypothetical protein
MNTNMQSGKTLAGVTEDGGVRRSSIWKAPAVITAILLSIPLLRSLFDSGWDWDIRVLLLVGAVGTLLFSIGLACQMVIRNLGTAWYRVAVGIALVAAFGLVWVNFVQAADGANPAAMGYLPVPLVGIIAAALARFRPDGMARALFVTALAQALVLAIVLFQNPPATSWSAAVWRGFGLNAFFVMLFVGSAKLFRRVARGELGPDQE